MPVSLVQYIKQHIYRLPGDITNRLFHRGQLGVIIVPKLNAVKACHGIVLRNPPARIRDRPARTDRHSVRESEDAGKLFAAAQ